MHNQVMSEIGRAIRNTLGDALDRAVRRTPDKIALLFAGRWYCDLAAAANRLARGLIALGLPPGNRVADYGKNSDAYVLLWLACNRAGLQIHVF